MVDIPCLPAQTFLCVGYPKGAAKLVATEEKTEIMVAEKWEDAKRHFENFRGVDCLLVLNQEDVQAMQDLLKDAVIQDNPLPEPSFLQKMFGHRSESGAIEKIRHFVYGKNAAGELLSVVVEASNQPSAFAAAGLAEPEMTPLGSFSEAQIKNLNASMERARTGELIVANVIAANNSADGIAEALAFLAREKEVAKK